MFSRALFLQTFYAFHLDTLRVPKLVPHPALQPGAQVVDPSKRKTKVFLDSEAWNPALRCRVSKVSGPRSKAKTLESDNANGLLSKWVQKTYIVAKWL